MVNPLKCTLRNHVLQIDLTGKIDDDNVGELITRIETELTSLLPVNVINKISLNDLAPESFVTLLEIHNTVLNADGLELLTEESLQVLKFLKLLLGDLTVINVSDSVYKIMKTTGFTELIYVKKKKL